MTALHRLSCLNSTPETRWRQCAKAGFRKEGNIHEGTRDGQEERRKPPPANAGRRSTDRQQPHTIKELCSWVETLPLSKERRDDLNARIAWLFERQRLQLEESKAEAIRVVTEVMAAKAETLLTLLQKKESEVSSIGAYAEQIVWELTERLSLDPKTKLLNQDCFQSRLARFLDIDTRSRWCAIGLADICRFKSLNDSLGHLVGDKVIVKIADILKSQFRTGDLVTREKGGFDDLHARFGGDEFCFLLTELDEPEQARAIGQRFLDAVKQYDWSMVSDKLLEPIRVAVGVVCLDMRHGPRTSHPLIERMIGLADGLMYEAKEGGALSVKCQAYRISGSGELESTGK